MKLNAHERKTVKDLADRLRNDLGAERVLLYGSAARDTLAEGSDIDLLVVFSDLDWELEKQVTDLCFDAELTCSRIISAQCMTTHELQDTPLRSSPFVRNIQRDGVAL